MATYTDTDQLYNQCAVKNSVAQTLFATYYGHILCVPNVLFTERMRVPHHTIPYHAST